MIMYSLAELDLNKSQLNEVMANLPLTAIGMEKMMVPNTVTNLLIIILCHVFSSPWAIS